MGMLSARPKGQERGKVRGKVAANPLLTSYEVWGALHAPKKMNFVHFGTWKSHQNSV